MARSVPREAVSAPPASRWGACPQRAESRTDPRELLRAILQRIENQAPFVLAVVLRTEGSTPAKAGSMALIAEGQVVAGTVGGGAVEAWSEAQAAEALGAGVPHIVTVTLTGDAVGEPDPVCGGVMRVLLDPRASRHAAAFAEALESMNRREPGALLFKVDIAHPKSASLEWVAELVQARGGCESRGADQDDGPEDEAHAALGSPAARDAQIEVLRIPLVRRPLLIIVGGGHVGQAVAAQAALVGFDIALVEDRREFASESLFPPGTRLRVGEIAGELAMLPLDPDTFVVLVSRGHRSDALALEVCLRRPVAYLGMIGSRRKVSLLRDEWLRSGRATAAEFDRVYAPIGLDIGASTVPEIACSIVAQLVCVRRKGAAPRMPRLAASP